MPIAVKDMPVYPRVGGGNGAPLFTGRIVGGLSPRGRGKLLSDPNTG